MTTYIELKNLANTIIDDSDLEGDIGGFINQGVSEIAGGMQSTLGSFITPPLPDLFFIGSVDTATDAAYVAMPDTFQRGLQFAANEDGVEIDIANSFIKFSAGNPLLDRTGRINEVVEQGGNLYYQGIPTTSEAIAVHSYRFPVAMASSNDTPDGIPAHLHTPLLVNYACWRAFELIEDGIEGPGVNTARYEKRFLTALRTLELSIPADTRSLYLGD